MGEEMYQPSFIMDQDFQRYLAVDQFHDEKQGDISGVEQTREQTGGGGGGEENECSLNSNAVISKYYPNKQEKYDLILTLEGRKRQILKHLQKQLEQHRGIKWYLSCKVKMVKSKPDGEEVSTPHFRSACMTTTHPNDIEEKYQQAIEKIKSSFLQYQKEGSGWQLEEVLHLDVGIASYKPLKGASFIPLPRRITDKKAVINIQNEDQKCFVWSVLASLHPVKTNPNRVQHYESYEHELNMEGIGYPVQIRDVPKFERQNIISVNVFGFENNELFPVYITKKKQPNHVNLLLFSKDDKRHFCCIRDLDRLLDSRTHHQHRMYHCVYCLHGFTRQDLLQNHEPHCVIHGPQRINLPDQDHSTISFKEVQKMLEAPFAIYADFESILVECRSTSLNDQVSGTQKTQRHQPCGFGYCVVSTVEKFNQAPVIYRGEDCVDRFLECLLNEAKRINEVLNHVEPMIITPEQEKAFQVATVCHICHKPLDNDRARDHDHVTGLYRGPSHIQCNLQFKYSTYIPVIMHSMRSYDTHLIMQGLGKIKSEKITCIPNNTEKYISFSVGNLVFIDSLQFLNSSLERLVDNLSREGDDKFKTLLKYIDHDKIHLLTKKGIYCYEYMDDFQKFDETCLPSIDHFYSTLTGTTVSEVDYAHAQQVFEAFDCRHLGDYHDLYLKSDVLLLADVFENFRSLCLKYYGLDPAHFYTSPGLAWSACLKMTGVELELITDPNQYLFIESGLRGGISMITHRYAKANNPYVPDYNPNQPHNYIIYLDMNNLYGTAMSEPLPVNNFRWLNPQEIEELNKNLATLPVDGSEGYILEVDLGYPKELHNLHNDYPLAPEKLHIPSEWLSSYCHQLVDDLQMKYTTSQKLVPNLHDKDHYVLHFRNLQQYMSLGMKLKTIHRVLSFNQSPWLKTYIDFNTDKRKNATNDFEKDFFKLMNNAVFGKTMENLRKRVNVKLVNTVQQLNKLTASPLFDYFRIFDEDLVAVNMMKPSLYLNRPIYVGFAILELSKTYMYAFHYDVIKAKYGDKSTLLFTDTDSLAYSIKTRDIYGDMSQEIHRYDTSEYPKDHPLFSLKNKKVLGKMKDETQGIAIEEFVGLRPKMYSLLYHQDGHEVEKKTAKGVAKLVTKRDIRHSHYKECLFHRKRTMANMWQIRSDKHQIYTVNINKIGLSPYDDKRYILQDGVTSLAYGHTNLP